MIVLEKVKFPEKEKGLQPVLLSDETMIMRKEKILKKMNDQNFDSLIIWADLEHGGNFEYLIGFLPRFEEALLVLHKDGEAQLVLGNENFNKASKARINVKPIHMPHFSLPNQPMDTDKNISETLECCNISNDKRIGIVGWKNFTSKNEENSSLFDLPAFIMDGIKTVAKEAIFVNATYLFIGQDGIRTTNNANEFAHYEFGAALAGNCILDAMEKINEGISEMEVAQSLDAFGQPHSVVTIMATGERFEKANMYPSNKKIKFQDTISITTGFKGGLQSRGGYAVNSEKDLPTNSKDYLNRVAKPYFQAVVSWLENIRIGMEGREIYELIEKVLPKEQYGWKLNPGHLCADEEWLSSPIYPNSKEILKSGMLFQIDIIPSVPGYGGISCESGIMLADSALRKSLKEEYPELWERIYNRQKYLRNELGINISDEIIPTSIATAFCNPFLLNKEIAFKQK